MSSNRLVYQNWIVEIGYDPDHPPPRGACETIYTGADPGSDRAEADRLGMIRGRVASALAQLDEQEREFIIRFHYQGQTYRSISRRSGRSIHRLETLHRRALKRLRRELAGWVEKTFGIDVTREDECIICRSKDRQAIDDLIANRDQTRNWKPVLEQLREKYGLTVRSPQLLIGHEKYHC
jgi:hypothetical protein